MEIEMSNENKEFKEETKEINSRVDNLDTEKKIQARDSKRKTEKEKTCNILKCKKCNENWKPPEMRNGD